MTVELSAREFRKIYAMRIEQIETALNEGVPFEITTAAGDRFRVNDKSRLWIARQRGAVFVMTDDELVHVIPFLTMTSFNYLKPQKP